MRFLLLGLAAGVWPAVSTADPAVVVRGPYLQSLLDDSAIVAWKTDVDSAGGVRWTGPDGTPREASESVLPGRDHRVKLAGLAPGATHRYAILDGGTAIAEEFEFRTAPPPGTGTIRIAAVGDSGKGNDPQRAVAAIIEEWRPDLFIHTGDIDYLGDIDRALFEPYRAILPWACFYPCKGNDGDPFQDWPGLFALPYDGPRGTSVYYSFDWGSAHFAALDTEALDELAEGGAQRTWVEADLAAARGRGMPWLILFFHIPPYTVGGHGLPAEVDPIRAVIPPIVDRCGVDLVLNGHDHDYQRSHPVRAGAVVRAWQDPRFVSPGAAIYVVTGGGGGVLHAELDWVDHQYTRLFKSTYHTVELTISPDRIDARAVSYKGAVIDSFSIEKGERPYLFVRGDTDGNRRLDLNDPIRLLGWLFLGESLDCPARCRLDGTAAAPSIADAIGLLSYLFLGGGAPTPPFPSCGPSATLDDSGCLLAACPE